jgi:serine/threonine protein kinase
MPKAQKRRDERKGVDDSSAKPKKRSRSILYDFGLARSLAKKEMTPNVASLWYRPPELLFAAKATSKGDYDSDKIQFEEREQSPCNYTQSIDLWAAACVYCELMLGTPPMNGRNELWQIRKVIDFVGLPPSDYMETIHNNSSIELPTTTSRTMLTKFSFLSIVGLRFLTGLFDYDPSKRWTAQQALECEYLTSDYPLPLSIEDMPRF